MSKIEEKFRKEYARENCPSNVANQEIVETSSVKQNKELSGHFGQKFAQKPRVKIQRTEEINPLELGTMSSQQKNMKYIFSCVNLSHLGWRKSTRNRGFLWQRSWDCSYLDIRTWLQWRIGDGFKICGFSRIVPHFVPEPLKPEDWKDYS